MSMFNLFGSADNTPAPAPVTPAPTAQNPVASAVQPVVPSVPAEPGNLPPAGEVSPVAPIGEPAPAPTPVAPVDDSPLAAFNTLWDDVPNKEGEPKSPVQTLDPVKLQEVIAKSDFSQSVSQENLAAIQAGGDEAATAFASSMNQVAQTVMNQSLLASNKMIEQAVERVNQTWEAKLPEILKKQNLNESLISSDPLFKNPAIKPIMEATQQQLASKYPTATVAELKTMTQDYIKAMGEAFSPKPVTPASKQNETDWDAYMTS